MDTVWHTRKYRYAMAVLALAAVAGTAAVKLGAGGATPAFAGTPSMLTTLKQHYGILSQNDATSLTPIPSVIADSPAFVGALTTLGADVSLARMSVGPDGIKAWLVPGNNGFCTIVSVPALEGSIMRACSDTLPADGYLGVTMGGPGSHTQGGFVANGNATVRLAGPAGSEPAIVSHNVFFAESAAGFSKMNFVGLSGSPVARQITVLSPGTFRGQMSRRTHRRR